VGCAAQSKNSDTSPKRIKHQRARCRAVPLPARTPLSHHFFHDPVPSSLSPRRGRYLYPFQPGRVSTQQAREIQERNHRAAAAFPDRPLPRADSGAGLSSHGSVSREESLRCRRRIIFVVGSSPLSISLHALVVGFSLWLRESFHSDVLPGDRTGGPCVHRSSPGFPRAPSASGFTASIDSSSKHRDIFTRRLAAFCSVYATTVGAC
jgi:hypothetical protein